MGLMWYLMGMGTTAALWGYLYLRRSYRLGAAANAVLLCTFALAWLCIGWSWGSFAEGEPQSGAMGLMCFGLPTLVMAVLSWRNLISPYKQA
ncbi:hypothetical protein SAMN04488540_1234 [Ferrimonas sediminum]|uniref:Tetrachloroethene dehalogenase n=2 Tax=Ferrimonas sediminum TaxID=718193 RepID=A0A1G9AFY0_9GAMM|nr:hypothetical protein SAMN04488540_1234 [Ferrimonas sediminum]